MTKTFSILTGSCIGSKKNVGAEFSGTRFTCQDCRQAVRLNYRGDILSHLAEGFHYLNQNGISGEMEYTGIHNFGGDCLLFGFAARGWNVERVAARMNFSLSELTRLHQFLGTVISEIEAECANSEEFSYSHVESANEYMLKQHQPPMRPVY